MLYDYSLEKFGFIGSINQRGTSIYRYIVTEYNVDNNIQQRVNRRLILGTHCSHGAIFTHYGDVIMSTMASQITILTIVYPTFYPFADQRKLQSSASLAFVRGIHWCPLNSPHKWPVTRKMFPFDDVIMMKHGPCVGITAGSLLFNRR